MAATSNGERQLRLSQLESNLSCAICQGYLIDATTITECMHTFCKSCLLRRLENVPSCPTCGILLQRSRLGDQLRLDHAIQLLVYTAVPGLWQEELRRRQYFSDNHPLTTSVAPPLHPPTCFAPTDPISLSLDFIPVSRNEDWAANGPPHPLQSAQSIGRRYFRCPAAVQVHHFQKLLSLKFELGTDYSVEIFCGGEKLDPKFRLMDVAYKSSWKQDDPLRLEFKIIRSIQSQKSSSSFSTSSIAVSTGSSSNRTSSSAPAAASLPTESTPSGGLKRRGRPSLDSNPSKARRMTKATSPERVQAAKRAPEERPSGEERLSLPQTTKGHSGRSSTPPAENPIPKPTAEVAPPGELTSIAEVKRRKPKSKRHKRKYSGDREHHPLKLKICEPVKSTELGEWTGSRKNGWMERSSGVELLVQAAELASRQCPTPPSSTPPTPPNSGADEMELTPVPPMIPSSSDESRQSNTESDSTHNNSTHPPTSESRAESVHETFSTPDPPAEETTGDQQQPPEEPSPPSEDEIPAPESPAHEEPSDSSVDLRVIKTPESNPPDSADQSDALDLSSKSSRNQPTQVQVAQVSQSSQASQPPQASQVKQQAAPPRTEETPHRNSSPQMQRSALHSITDSLVQRQHQRQLLSTQRPVVPKTAPIPAASGDAMRNLLTLSQTAAMVSNRAAPQLHPHHHQTERATQRFIAAMYSAAAAAVAAAAAAAKPPPSAASVASAPLRIPRSVDPAALAATHAAASAGSNHRGAKTHTKSMSYNFHSIRRPY